MARAVLQARPFAAHNVDEVFPGNDIRTDDEILDVAQQRGGTVNHRYGTARMGPDSDSQAVVDASIMPAPISGPTNASTIRIGEKAADMILQDAARPRVQVVG